MSSRKIPEHVQTILDHFGIDHAKMTSHELGGDGTLRLVDNHFCSHQISKSGHVPPRFGVRVGVHQSRDGSFRPVALLGHRRLGEGDAELHRYEEIIGARSEPSSEEGYRALRIRTEEQIDRDLENMSFPKGRGDRNKYGWIQLTSH